MADYLAIMADAWQDGYRAGLAAPTIRPKDAR